MGRDFLLWGPSSQPQYQELGNMNVLILIDYVVTALSLSYGFLVPPSRARCILGGGVRAAGGMFMLTPTVRMLVWVWPPLRKSRAQRAPHTLSTEADGGG